MGFFSKIGLGLKKTRESVSQAFNSVINSFTKIDEEFFEELEEIMIMSDIGVRTSEHICDELRQRVKKDGIKDPAEIKELLKETIAELVSGDVSLKLNTKPSVIIVIGVNGVGKTTTIAKLAHNLKSEGKSVILGAADTFRAAAIEQLEVWADRVGVEVVKSHEGADPSSVIFDTIAAAKNRNKDVIICDTAGRLHNKSNLMNELAKMCRVIRRELPDADVETLLVLDAITGQNAVNQAEQFKQVADITGIVLTKLDGTAKGGVILPIMDELKIPVKFVGVGEQMDDLMPFDPKEFAEGILAGDDEN